MKTDADFKRWFKRFWYLNDWIKARKFNAHGLNKFELIKALASRNLYIRKCVQEEFANRISGPILEVIKNAPVFPSLFS